MYLASCLLALFVAPRAPVFAQEQLKNIGQAGEQVWLELGSEFTTADPAARAAILESIDKESELLDEQSDLLVTALDADPDARFRALSPARTSEATDYIRALKISYARFKGAQASGDAAWSAKQLKAAQEYAKLAANALIKEAVLNEGEAARWRSSPFAVHRSPEVQAAYMKKFKADGLTAEQRKLLLDGGASETSIEQFQKQLLEAPPDQIGLSAAEWFSRIAAARRKLAEQLSAFGQRSPGAVSGTSAQAFAVGNPHDREETIDLFIRAISIPADWKLSILDAGEQAQFKVREIEAGKHYAVTLPAHAQLKVASVVVPVGEVGTNTIARWAVEGKIGNELIGGMMHEMNVPYIIADLKLPPVGSQEVEEDLPASSKPWARIAAEVAAGIVLLGVLVYLVVFWRKRQRAGPSPSA